MAKTDTPLGKTIREIIDSGSYVTSEYIRDVIGQFVESHTDTPVLFDGPIRSAEQDSVIRPILGECVVIALDLDKDKAIERLLHRRIDPETGETFPENFSGNINPKTGNALVTRKDDNAEAIEKRIEWSLAESLPLIEIWKKDGYRVFHVDADRHIDDVFAEISHIITSLSR